MVVLKRYLPKIHNKDIFLKPVARYRLPHFVEIVKLKLEVLFGDYIGNVQNLRIIIGKI